MDTIKFLKGDILKIYEYAYLLKHLIGSDAAFKYVRSKIAHHLENEFVSQREFTLDYWESVEKEL